MKFSELQTVSKRASVAQEASPTKLSDARLHELATEFEALLLNVALRPMSKSLGPMSEVVSQKLAMQVAANSSDPLYQQLRAEMG